MSKPETVTETLSFNDARPSADRAGLVTLYTPTLDELASAYPITSSGLVLGRDPPPSGIPLRFASASRVHTRVGFERGVLMVEDMGSRNGTFVNRRRIERPIEVDAGDVIRVGEALFKVVREGISGYAGFPLKGPALVGPTASLRGGYVMSSVREQIERVAPSELPVLFLGETGTGKEVAARALHDASGRTGALCAVNCAAIPAALLESELFGHRRGAFTGADRDRLGLVRSAHQGTLFLDEIGDMPLEAQAKLLRFLETKQVTPLGSHKAEDVDVRVVCATHRPLLRMVREERFRADLYARIGGHAIELPPLEARREDVYQLVRFFLERGNAGAHVVRPAFMIALVSHDWPFNVRELASVIQRAITLSDGTLDVRHLPAEIAAALDAPPPEKKADASPNREREEPRASPSEDELRELLTRHEGNISAVARELGKDRTQIRRWLTRFGLSLDDFRPSTG